MIIKNWQQEQHVWILIQIHRLIKNLLLQHLQCGLAGEAGEVVDLLKKVLGHGHELDLTKLSKELGDVLWYASQLAEQHGLKLSEIAEANIAKLKARYPEGFTEDASKNRKE